MPTVVVEKLAYQSDYDPSGGEALTEGMVQAAARALGEPPAVWHIHNPTLGKNVHLPQAIERLARTGARLVLQCHDFAEDGRPGNYELLGERKRLYPMAPQVRYVTINSRDLGMLVVAGVPEEQTTLLPNAVTAPVTPTEGLRATGDPPFVVYGVRGIRRKNLGELCLLAGLAPPEAGFALTLRPANPEWLPIYERWEKVAGTLSLPLDFGVVGDRSPASGVEPSYENWLGRASHLVTTSIAEGFGLSFLEPIAMEKPLLGRDLPEITCDFKGPSVSLGTLYDNVLIPSAWIDRRELANEFRARLQEVYESYGLELAEAAVREAHETLFGGPHLDFGNLPEHLQEQALASALRSPDDVLVEGNDTWEPLRPWLAGALANERPPTDPSVLELYSIARYGESLTTLYRDVEHAPVETPSWLDRARILDQFLKPERFHFLRT